MMDEPEALVTLAEGIRAMKIVQKFVQDDPAALDLFYKLDDTISKKRYRKMQQTEISDFFQPIGGTSFTH